MGSKRALLNNGLGEQLKHAAKQHDRVVDLFAGSASVSWFAATNTFIPVLACDLQSYSKVLAEAVLLRSQPMNLTTTAIKNWFHEADAARRRSPRWGNEFERPFGLTSDDVHRSRKQCADAGDESIWSSYGGHYYSPDQALTFDSLLSELPTGRVTRQACLASVIWAGTRCAAAPGHTAQPFQPTTSGLPYIEGAWKRDPIDVARSAIQEIGALTANTPGQAVIADANALIRTLKPRDLVFIDPPYSAVQYSRFYHVLERLSSQGQGKVSGVGRYPNPSYRPRSSYSLQSQAQASMFDLLDGLKDAGSSALITFPRDVGSNGLSGTQIVSEAKKAFTVDVRAVSSRFSTMGGNGKKRSARRTSSELVISLSPRRHRTGSIS